MLLSARSHVGLVNGGNSCSVSEPIIHRAGVTNTVHAGTRLLLLLLVITITITYVDMWNS